MPANICALNKVVQSEDLLQRMLTLLIIKIPSNNQGATNGLRHVRMYVRTYVRQRLNFVALRTRKKQLQYVGVRLVSLFCVRQRNV